MAKNRIASLRRARGLTLEQLAEASGLSAGYLSRLQTGKRDLSVEAAEQIAAALGTSAAEVLGFESTSATARPAHGLNEDDAEPYVAGPGEADIKPRDPNSYMMRVNTNALENLGLRRGDLIEVNGSSQVCAEPPPLAIVRVQYHYDHEDMMKAVTLLRQFIPPTKLITNAPNTDAPTLDLDRDDVQILGVVTWSHRKLG